MSAYYFEGNNIDWFICLCLFLVVICVVNALAMFVIPEKFSLQVSRGKTLACSALIGGVSFITLVVFASQSFTMDELDVGRYWKNDCKLLEVNIPTGAFTEPVNKLTVPESSLMCQWLSMRSISDSGNYIRLK